MSTEEIQQNTRTGLTL